MTKAMNKTMRKLIFDLAEQSKCTDRGVACVICSNDMHQIYSIGINGTGKGSNIECLCNNNDSKYSCIHAEANALVKLTTFATNKIAICSLMPCAQCSAMFLNEPGGFAEVWYLEEYHDTIGVNMLIAQGIKVGLLEKSGTVRYRENSLNSL